jgi:hypothetical protein
VSAFVINPYSVLFTPNRLANLALWLDAGDSGTVILNGSDVSEWRDKSGNGRNASQATAARQPEYISSAQNGLGALRFDAASEHFMTAGTTSTWNFLHNGSNAAVFILARCRSTGENPNAAHTYLSTGGAATASIGFFFAYDDRAAVPRNNAAVVSVARGVLGAAAALESTNDKLTPGTYHLISSYIDADNGTAANRTVQRVDGDASFGSNTLTNAPSASNSTSSLHIGRDVATPTLDFTGDICEVCIFDNHPATADRERIEGYLAHKWGVAANLPAGHPYKTSAP